MGLKLEMLITVVIIAIFSATLMVKFTHQSSNGKLFTKELEFTDTTLTEVDTQGMQGRAFGTYGIRDTGVLSMYNIKYHTDSIQLLRAKKATYKGDNIYLDGNITINQKEGFDYSAQHAVYNKQTKMLDVTSAFIAVMNNNTITGDTLHYDTQKKDATAKRIDAVLYTTEK
jgi:type II secretory pathway pseudopilin PulG